MTRRILVTGGAGMIGSNLTRCLRREGYDVTVVDNLWRGKLNYLEDESGRSCLDLDTRFFERDLSIPGQLDDLLVGIDIVYHLADVVAGVDYVFKNEGSIFRENLLINSNVVTSARAYARTLQGFIYVGTACSFPEHLQSGVDAAPLKESDQYPASPESAYGWSKLMGEYEALLLEKETGIPVSIPILHNVYGTPCDFEEPRAQVIPSLARKLVSYPNEPFIIWGSGEQGRAFVHVNDVVDGLVACMARGLGQGVVQLGPDQCTSIRELAELLINASGKNAKMQFDRTKPEGDRGRCADFSKATEVLGWTPKVALSDGLGELYSWVQTQATQQTQPV